MRPLSEFTTAVWFPVALLPLLLFAHYSRVAQPFEYIILRVLTSLQTPITAAVGLPSTPTFGQQPSQAAANIVTDREATLADQVQNLIVENAHLQTLVEEAQLLEEERAFLESRALQGVPARVTTRTTEGLSQAVIINRGTHNGLSVGLPVITNSGVLIGTITRCASNTSTVLLITSHSSRINAAVQNTLHSPGIIQGAFNISLQMQYIPQSDPLAPGDVVVTSGNDPSVPEGLVIGSIEETHSEPGAIFQRANVQPFFEAAQLSVVSVLLP